MDTIFQRRQFLQMGAALSVGACVPATIGPKTASSKFNWRLQSAQSAGMSAEGIEGIRTAVQKNIDAKVIAGAVTAVARHNKLIWFEAQGMADIENNKPMQKDSLFRMASSTKVMTSVAVMMMIEEGKLGLDDPVSKYIPSFKDQRVAINPAGNTDPAKVTFVPAIRDITIKDLLTHTSGLGSVGELIFPGAASMVNKVERKPDDTLAEFIPKLGGNALEFQPGSKWRYSPLDGMDVLLYLVELVSKTPAEDFMRERLFEPVDMRSTYFLPTHEARSRLVKIYAAKDGKLVPGTPVLGENKDLFPYVSGAGGSLSTAHDMLNFELMLLNKGSFNGNRILKPETVELMSTNQVGTMFAEWIPSYTAGRGFGLGVSTIEDESKGNGRSVGAFGWGGAYGTETWADPKLDIAGVLLIQMSPAPPGPFADFSKAIKNAVIA